MHCKFTFTAVLFISMALTGLLAQTSTFTGSVDDDWLNEDNWTHGIPDASTSAVISNVVAIVRFSAECANLTISPTSSSVSIILLGSSSLGASLTVNGNMQISDGGGNNLSINGYSTVTVAGNFINQESVSIAANGRLLVNGTFTNSDLFAILSGGSLITNNSVENTGSFRIDRTLSFKLWHLMSIPLASADSYTYFLNDFLQEWNPVTETWRQITSPTETLSAMKGYSYYGGNTLQDKTVQFFGTPNTGNQSIALTAVQPGKGIYSGFNLVGNPYPSGIDWSLLDDTYGAIYYWKDNAYISWNNGIGSGSSIVPAMQGFFIFCPAPPGKPDPDLAFNLNDNHRVHPTPKVFYKSEVDTQTIVLETVSHEYSDKLFITLDNQWNTGFDYKADAFKMLSPADGLSQIYTIGDDDILSIDVRPETDVIQLGFANNEAGVYNIGISEIMGINTTFLEDTKTGVSHDLSKGAYEFSWDPQTDDATRFKLHLKSTGTGDNQMAEKVSIFSHSGKIIIRGNVGGEVSVSDLHGQTFLTEQMYGNHEIAIPSGLSSGVYLVTVKSGSGVTTKKVFIQSIN